MAASDRKPQNQGMSVEVQMRNVNLHLDQSSVLVENHQPAHFSAAPQMLHRLLHVLERYRPARLQLSVHFRRGRRVTQRLFNHPVSYLVEQLWRQFVPDPGPKSNAMRSTNMPRCLPISSSQQVAARNLTKFFSC